MWRATGRVGVAFHDEQLSKHHVDRRLVRVHLDVELHDGDGAGQVAPILGQHLGQIRQGS